MAAGTATPHNPSTGLYIDFTEFVQRAFIMFLSVSTVYQHPLLIWPYDIMILATLLSVIYHTFRTFHTF